MYELWIAVVLMLDEHAACKLSIRCNEVARRVGILEDGEYSVLEFAKAVTSQEFEG